MKEEMFGSATRVRGGRRFEDPVRRRRTPVRAATCALIAVVVGAGGAAAQTPLVSIDTLAVRVGSRASTALPVATRAVEVITAEALAATPARTVADVLFWALGVDLQARSSAQADLSLRGGSFEQVLVLVDGARMSGAQTGHFDLDLAIPLAEVERIEVLRGPATALYGADAVGGVINIVTRRGAEGVRVSVEGGSFGTGAATASAGFDGDALGIRAAGAYRRSDGHRPGTDFRSAEGRLAADGRLGDRTLRADVAFAARDFGARAFYTPPQAPYDEFEETRTATASLAVLAPADARVALEPRITVRRHDDDFLLYRDDPSFYRNRHTSWQFGGELVARYAALPSLRLVIGGEAYRDVLESSSLGDREEDRGAVFGEAALGSIGRAVLNVGLRADWHETFGGFLAPSLAAALWPSDRLRLRGSVGRSFRTPTWTDRYYVGPENVGSADLEPERAWSAELGADLTPAAGVRLGITGFVRAAEDLIDWARPAADLPAPDAPWRARNVEDATFRGLELEAVLAGPLGARWTLGATALSFDGEDTGGYISRYALRPLTRTASLAIERPLFAENLLVAARVRYGRRAGRDAPAISDGACVSGAEQEQTRADGRVSYRFREGRVFLDVQNLTDETDCDISATFVPGRAAYVGFAWEFGG
ncbi:MAG TPA: TonB-dependent receptor [Longimicrobiales bacterium]